MIAGRYTLLREIGHGGMGAVHLARDEVLDREVAVKRIGMVPGADSPDLARVEREARLAAQINHPHVVAVFDLVEHEGHHWLVMEYVAGETLADRIKRTGPLGQREAAQVLWQAADALAAAHSAGIVHRDVKPSNILIGADGHAKLADFGIARAQADATLTQTGMVTGSPAYIAPEVASGHLAEAAADVWSLGATLFHALAGRPPYDVSENLIGGLYQIVNEEPPRLAGAGRLGLVLEATMERQVDARWPMLRVRDALAEVANDPTTPTLPLSPGAGPDRSAASVAGAATETMRPVPAAAPTEPQPTESPSPPPPTSGRRGSLLPALLLVATLLLAAGLGWAWWQGRTVEPDPEAQPSGTQRSTQSSPSSPTETPSPTESPSPTETPSRARTEQGMRDFITTYLATVTSDPRATYAMLTPEFQAASGYFEDYSAFWGNIRSASPREVEVDPEGLTVSYQVDYVHQDGSRTTDDVSLQLVRQDDGYLIAGES
ncbi:serine/threonine-protein kinase [Nocardioides gansuensis]|uniref:serine/threonine-protein kinase n=1 Tax=Nocardioides gansuensis TaxID=2138300 RepID=UPI0010577F71|nr:serine/threonine-protein kinase [Nocardioides gansuensis]